jgi:hypothetical protein
MVNGPENAHFKSHDSVMPNCELLLWSDDHSRPEETRTKVKDDKKTRQDLLHSTVETDCS